MNVVLPEPVPPLTRMLSRARTQTRKSSAIASDMARRSAMSSRLMPRMVKRRMEGIVAGQAAAYDVDVKLDYRAGYAATVNDPTKAAFASTVAEQIVGPENVDGAAGREMGAEDFAYMLERRPGAYLFLGQGDSAGLHHPEYEFNDAIAPIGASFFAKLVESAQPVA